MKPEDFMTPDMMADMHDYNVRDDDTIVAIIEVESDCYVGDVELTKDEIEAAIQYAIDNNYDGEVIGALEDGKDMIERAEAQADPRVPDLNSLLFGPNPNDPQP